MPLLCCSAPRAREHHRPFGAREQPDRGALLGDRHAGDPLDPLGPVARPPPGARRRTPWSAWRCTCSSTCPSAIAMCSSPFASARSVPGVTCRCSVAAGAVGVRRGSTTISAPPLSRWSESYRVNGGMVSATLLPTSRMASARREIRQRERQPAVDAEGSDARRRRRRHAEPAVVVDIGGAERDPRELAQRIRLLVGQPAAAEDRDAVRPVRGLEVPDFSHHPGQRLVPAGRLQPSRPVRPDQRRRQPVRRSEQLRRRPPLLAQASSVRREIPGAHQQLVADVAQRHAALQGAVRAMGKNPWHRHASTLCGSRYPQSSCALHSRNGHLSAA